ncbi:uncharacterized protein LOC122243868 [Penaeus japonicus]|uniref:uncharacterized protein LOC122243868 n=1 Tax=Penaeus japonicus TaxID=27405 RepID=UPI001C7121E9|nr:uncharacterized protein LOC122243868 [Penaeus japonicus]
MATSLPSRHSSTQTAPLQRMLIYKGHGGSHSYPLEEWNAVVGKYSQTCFGKYEPLLLPVRIWRYTAQGAALTGSRLSAAVSAELYSQECLKPQDGDKVPRLRVCVLSTSVQAGFFHLREQLVTENEHIVRDTVSSLGHTWISEDDTEGCHANKVTLSKGQLMDECSEGAPVWQVSGEKCVEIPVPRLQPTWMVHFTLLSSKAFIPSFTVGGIQLVLGWLDGGLAVVAGDGAEPLPSHTHHCLTIEISSNEKTTLKVLANGRMDQTLTLSAAPNIILACGNLSGVFTLQQHKDSSDCGNISIPSTQAPVTDAPDSTLLMVGTSTIASAVAGILVCLCCAIRRRGQDTRGNSLPPSTSPPEPLPVFPPRLTPFLQHESRANYPMPLPPLRLQEPLPIIPFEQQCPLSGPGSDEDEIYHEMITLATTKPPPGSYVHEETEETINDMYVSADMLTD